MMGPKGRTAQGKAAAVRGRMRLDGRRTLGQLVADEILTKIEAGEIRPGDRLPTERGLMEEYGVGRNAVREAVQSLVSRGVLDVRPGRGSIALDFDSHRALDPRTVSALLADQAVADLYEFRQIVEVEMAERAARRATEGELDAISEALDRYSTAYQEGVAVYRADLEFHERIAEAAHNVIMSRVLDTLAGLLAAVRSETDKVPGATERAMREHTAIHQAIARRDPSAARDAMSTHIQSAIWAISEARRLGASTNARTPGRLSGEEQSDPSAKRSDPLVGKT